MEWEQELELAADAAKTAGELLHERRHASTQVVDNSGRDLKLWADREAEQVILEKLTTHSRFSILTEESGQLGELDLENPIWIIDPLDGTLNYGQGIPLSCVSIGLWLADRPLLGVVYDFWRDELYTGVVGQGASCNGEPITVAPVEETTQAVLTTGFPVGRDFDDEPLLLFVKRVKGFKKVRLLGSAALSLAYVACGRAHAYSEESIKLWDVAAGLALVMAAGGSVSVSASPRHPWARTVVASTSELLVRALTDDWKPDSV